MSVYVPEEIVEQILARLPPRAVLRCGAMSKQVYSLINRSGFISKTLSYTLSARKHSSQVVSLTNFYDLGSIFSLYLDPFTVDDYKHDIPSPFPTDKSYRCALIDSIHGLVCVAKFGFHDLDPAEIYIWNPLIRRYIKTPNCSLLGSDPLFFGFGFDSIRSDYKVIVIGYDRETYSKFSVQLYSSKQGIWRDINEQWLNSSGIICLARFPGRRFQNGVIHWLASRENDESLIIGFDVSRESFKAMKSPCNSIDDTKLFQIGESLACIHQDDSFFSIWLMKDYGVESSWTKIYSIPYHGFSASIVGIPEDGDFLIVNYYFKGSEELFWFNPENRATTETGIRVHDCAVQASSYTESLILMDKESGALSC